MLPTKIKMNKNPNTFLITGAAGFLGYYISKILLEENSSNVVVGMDNLTKYYPVKLKKHRLNKLVRNKRFIFYKTSILNESALKSIIRKHKPSIVVHAAAEVGVRSGQNHPVKYYKTNTIGTGLLLESLHKSTKHVVVLSSSSVYGLKNNTPFKEGQPIDLFTPLSAYGSSKLAAEIIVYNYHLRTKTPTTIIRPFSVYGPNGRPDMLPLKTLMSGVKNKSLNLYGPGTNSRDWTFIDDFIAAIEKVINKPKGFQVINVGRGSPVSNLKVIMIAQKILKKNGYTLSIKKLRARPEEPSSTFADVSKLFKIYNFRPKTDFEVGFSKTADYFFSHLNLYKQYE